MLILVGVTINVVLNVGLFGNAKKATYQTEASMIKEQLEIAKALEITNNGGNLLDDYSIITVAGLDIDEGIKNKYKDKILVNASGDILYNPDAVTDEEKTWLQEIGINPNTIKVRVPFTNYIENGNYYYVEVDNDGNYLQDNYSVVTFSNKGQFMKYTIENGIATSAETETFTIIDKNKIEEVTGFGPETICNMVPGINSFEEMADDNILYEYGLNIFKTRYNEVFVEDMWLKLKPDFELNLGYKPDVTYNAAYVGKNSDKMEVYIILYETGELKIVYPSINYVTPPLKYKIEESATIRINGNDESYNNVIYAEGIGSDGNPNDEYSLFGYFSDRDNLHSIDGIPNKDGSYPEASWIDMTLDIKKDVSAYL